MFILIFGPRAHLRRVSSLGLEPCPFLFAYLFYSNLLSRYVFVIYVVFISSLYVVFVSYHVMFFVFFFTSNIVLFI